MSTFDLRTSVTNLSRWRPNSWEPCEDLSGLKLEGFERTIAYMEQLPDHQFRMDCFMDDLNGKRHLCIMGCAYMAHKDDFHECRMRASFGDYSPCEHAIQSLGFIHAEDPRFKELFLGRFATGMRISRQEAIAYLMARFVEPLRRQRKRSRQREGEWGLWRWFTKQEEAV